MARFASSRIFLDGYSNQEKTTVSSAPAFHRSLKNR